MARIGDCFRRGLVAEPVADPVGVARPDERRHARGDDGGKLREEGARVCKERDEISQVGGGIGHVRGRLAETYRHRFC